MAQPAYSYDPEKIKEPGKDKMRFELGTQWSRAASTPVR